MTKVKERDKFRFTLTHAQGGELVRQLYKSMEDEPPVTDSDKFKWYICLKLERAMKQSRAQRNK